MPLKSATFKKTKRSGANQADQADHNVENRPMEFSLETVKGSILNGLKILVPLSFPRLPKAASARGHPY